MSETLSTPIENYHLLRIYSYYRVALALLLGVMYWALSQATGARDLFLPTLYQYTAIPYGLSNVLLLAFVLAKPRDPRPRHIFSLLMIDVAALVLISHASGGINSGFSVLLMVTVATGAIFVPGQIATLVAAIASLAVLFDTAYLILVQDGKSADVFPAGVLGVLLFASSLVVQRLATNLRSSREIAAVKTEEVADLQSINQLIIQRMQTGVLFLNAQDALVSINQSALRLMSLQGDITRPDQIELPPQVNAALTEWRGHPNIDIRPFKLKETGPLLQLTFSPLDTSSASATLVFVEDFTQVGQQAQQLKLMSLGRLTASIAHEIRNPLNSINHAAQLLRESELLDEDDRRLSDIVISNAARTNEVIENVLTLSRGSPPRGEVIELAAWLRRMIDELRLRHADERISVEFDLHPDEIAVKADTTHLRQILNNLCENGIRYSQRAIGSMQLRLRARLLDDTRTPVLDIVDFGEGIPESAIAHIFEPFFTTEHKGTGLGLYLARELCEANQIQMEYLRDQDNHSCFRLYFPRSDHMTAQSTR